MNHKQIQRKELIADLEQVAVKHGCNLAHIHTITAPSSPKKRGRPRGSGIDDAALLARMEELLIAGSCKSCHAAAVQVAKQIKGHSIDSTSRRLAGKYKRYKATTRVTVQEEVLGEERIGQAKARLSAMPYVLNNIANSPMMKGLNALANSPMMKLMGGVASGLSYNSGLSQFAKMAEQWAAPLPLLPDISHFNLLGSFVATNHGKVLANSQLTDVNSTQEEMRIPLVQVNRSDE